MVLKIIKVGNGAGVIIPKEELDKLNVNIGDVVEIEIKAVSEKPGSDQAQ